ncbi:MAG: DUF58 domain-containing protein [Deltaproteobacteria bacterium]|nr:MAG: DUF58 domain-containing protein [Deltaproteobacteria bacterium]
MTKRLLHISFRFAYIVKRWITSRFTKAGLLVAGGIVASAVVGLDTNQTLAYQAFTFLLALIFTSMACGMLFRGRFIARRKLPRFGTVHEPLTYRIVIENKTPKRQRRLSVREDLEDMCPSFEEFLQAPAEPDEKTRNPFDRAIGYHRWLWLLSRKQAAAAREQEIPLLPPYGEQELRVEIVPSHRGDLRLSGLAIVRTDPFGLWRSFFSIPIKQNVLVLPKRYPLPPIQLPGTRKYQPGGVALASSVGESEEFVSLRDYHPGDPLRRIHWRSWAKTGKPIVKEYQDEFFVRHALILDTFQDTGGSEILEEAVSVAASFAYSIQTQESLLDLMFVGTEAFCFTSGRGLAHVDKMLEILASVRACTDRPFSTLPALVMERAALLSGCICVLLSWDEQRQAFIGLLKALGLPVLVLVVAEDKASRPLDPGPMKGDLEHLHRLQTGKIEEGLAQL